MSRQIRPFCKPAACAASRCASTECGGCRAGRTLYEWGFARPQEQTVDVGIGYATQQLRIPDGLIAEKVVVAGVSRTQQTRLGMLPFGDAVVSFNPTYGQRMTINAIGDLTLHGTEDPAPWRYRPVGAAGR